MSISPSINPSIEQASNSSEHEYAYYFPEGSGYLYIRHLGKGIQGTADLVWSCAEASQEQAMKLVQANGVNVHDANHDQVEKFLYVRKKTLPEKEGGSNGNPNSWPVHIPEVRHFRNHAHIPRLIDWTEYHPLPFKRGSHLQYLMTSMIFQRCNGGSLLGLMKDYQVLRDQRRLLADFRPVYIPEAIIWTVFGQVLEIANWLHHQRPRMYHHDIHLGNIFFHLSEDDKMLPDCFLGDFGLSELAPAPTRMQEEVDLRITDYEHLLLMIKELMILDSSAEVGSDQIYNNYDARAVHKLHYSPWLYDAIRRIFDIVQDCRSNNVLYDFAEDARKMINMGAAISGVAPEALRINRIYDYEPLTFSSAADLLNQPRGKLPVGPWKVAKIRQDTKEVVALSREVYRTYQPQKPNSPRTYFFRRDDSHSLPSSERDIPVATM